MNTFLIAVLAAALLYDSKTQKEYLIQLKLKDIILDFCSYEELAGAYYLEFGDGEKLEDLMKQLKRL